MSSSKRKNVPTKLSPTMPKLNNIDDGSIRPDLTSTYGDQEPISVDINSKRSSVNDCSQDNQTSLSMIEKSVASFPLEDVRNIVEKTVLNSGDSVTEKQRILSEIITSLQHLSKNLVQNEVIIEVSVTCLHYYLRNFVC